MENTQFSYRTNGSYTTLVYALTVEEGATKFEHGMLANNEIRGILGYSYFKDDTGVFLAYNIIRGTRLSLLRRSKLSKNAVLSIFCSIADVIMRSDEFMLDERHFVLDDDCIFVDTTSFSVDLVFVPTNLYSGKSFGAFLKECVTNSMFETNDDVYPMKILNYINTKPTATIADLRGFLQSLMADNPTQILVDNPEPNEPFVKPGTVAPNNETVSSEQKKTGLFGGLFGKGKKKSQQNNAFGGMVVPGSEDIITDIDKTEHPETNNNAGQPTNVPTVDIEVASESPRTVRRGYKTKDFSTQRQYPYLISEKGEKNMITKVCFVIGKDAQAPIPNDLIIKHPEVSRNHAMITYRDGGYFITDMTSLNGTFVNGEKIPSGVEMNINPGDVISLSDQKFTFRIE